MGILRDFISEGFPAIGAIGGAAYAGARSKRLPVILAYGSGGWAVGWLSQWLINKALDGPGEQLPINVGAPMALPASSEPRSLDDVMKRVEETSVSPTPMASPGPPKSDTKAKAVGKVSNVTPINPKSNPEFYGFDPSSMGSNGAN